MTRAPGNRHRIELPLLFLLLLVGGAPAQEPADEETERDDASPGRKRARILHLSSGETLRGRARPSGAGWEIDLAGRTVVVPESAVVRAPLERDVLRRARELQRELAHGRFADARRHVAYADWCAREGLVPEAVEALDRALEHAPDEPRALELARSLEPRLSLPTLDGGNGALDAYVRAGSAAGPAAREMAVHRLARRSEEAEVPGLYEALRSELVSWNTRRRGFAALALQRLFPGRAVKDLLARAVLDGSRDVRSGAARALAAPGEPAVILPVLRALDSESHSVRTNAAEALGEMGFPAAVEPLVARLAATSTAVQSAGSAASPRSHIFVGKQIAYIQDYDVEVAQGSAIADPNVSVLTEGTVLDVRVLGVSVQAVQTERVAIRRALEQLTGASPGHTVESWLSWWEENGNAWRTAPPSDPTSPQSPGG